MKDFKIEKYPEWCIDEVDRIIHEIIVLPENIELTQTQIKNSIYSKVFENLAKESLNERLEKLKKKGIIEDADKEKKIKVWRKKK